MAYMMGTNITPAKRAKELGAKSLNQVAHSYGCSIQNLSHKYKTKPNQFDIIVLGVIASIGKGVRL